MEIDPTPENKDPAMETVPAAQASVIEPAAASSTATGNSAPATPKRPNPAVLKAAANSPSMDEEELLKLSADANLTDGEVSDGCLYEDASRLSNNSNDPKSRRDSVPKMPENP